MPRNNPRRTAWIVAMITPIFTVSIGSFVLWKWLPYPLGTGCVLTLVALLSVTIYTDSHWKKIPNWATYPAFVWILIFNLVGTFWPSAPVSAIDIQLSTFWPVAGPIALGAIGIVNCLLGAVACFCVMLVLSGWLKSSGGDVKLLTVIGACVGAQYGLLAMCIGYVLAGVYASVVCIWHYGFFNIVKGVGNWIGNLFFPWKFAKPRIQDDQFLNSGVPLGAHFALGTLIALVRMVPGIQS